MQSIGYERDFYRKILLAAVEWLSGEYIRSECAKRRGVVERKESVDFACENLIKI